jgi:hypothetical protein
MIKKLKPFILFLVQFMFLQGVNCQNPVNIPDYLSQRFTRYIKSVPREEIFIHSDRKEYLSGEDIWFNVYLIDRQTFKPSSNSKIAYFELLNSENRPVIQKRILLEGGFGPGQIVLPDTLSTGSYTIRAYTNWMKNFLPVNCFTQDIKIYNAFSIKTVKRKTHSEDITKEKVGLDVSDGLTLSVNNLEKDVLEIFVKTDEKFRSENSSLCYLFIQTHGNIDYVRAESLRDENTKIVIGKSLLTEGINQITVFNSKGKPICERLIYTPGKEKPVITLHSLDSLGMRDKETLDFTIGNGSSAELNSRNLSISVSPVTNDHSGEDINDYLVFGTEFGSSPWKAIKDNKVDEIPVAVMDSLLQTVHSNWINWNSILTDELPVFKYQFEKENHYLFGKLLNNNPKPEDSDKFLILSIPGKVAVFQYARTDNTGNFSFKVPISMEQKEFIIQPDGVTVNLTINIESPFSDQFVKAGTSAELTIPPYISTWSVNHQVRKIYGISSTGTTLASAESKPMFKRFYGKPTNELVMKDYITLPVMQEVFFELLAGVSLKTKKTGYEITINDPSINKPYEYPPSLFVDGVLVKDASVIAAIDPEIVEKIDVVRDKYFVGDYLFYGIINVITKAGDFSNATLPDHALRLAYRVVDPISSFVSPDYSSSDTRAKRVPDFRTTLYWNPSVKQDKEGKARIEFWTSDFSSDYEINVQGITSDGKPFSIKKTIKVKR